jgi:arylsulfatase A-like enzyme
MIVCDTLRKDIIDVYGGPARVPNIREFAETAMVYQNAIAASPASAPAHASLFSGLYPREHEVHEEGKLDIEKIINKYRQVKSKVLPEYLQEDGYNTIALSNNMWVSELFGFDRGFNTFLYLDTYPEWLAKKITEAEHYGANKKEILINLIRRGEFKKLREFYKTIKKKQEVDRTFDFPLNKGGDLTANFVANLNLKSDKPFFLFINLVEPHEPYRNETLEERWDVMLGIRAQTNKRASEIKKEYIKEAEYLDNVVGRILNSLKQKEVYENSIILILGDHGQAFNEHGFMYHGIYLFDEIIRVPLLIRYPYGKRYKERKEFQSLTKIYPLIKNIIEGKDDAVLTTETALAQGFGFGHEVPVRYKGREKEFNPQFYKLREAVYTKEGKTTRNLTDNIVEEEIKFK